MLPKVQWKELMAQSVTGLLTILNREFMYQSDMERIKSITLDASGQWRIIYWVPAQ